MHRRAVAVPFAVAFAVAAVAAAFAPPSEAEVAVRGIHDARYCEVLELRGAPPKATVTVWNSIAFNRCPAARWQDLDASALAKERGAAAVILNGPRHFLMDVASDRRAGATHSFGGIKMSRVATIPIRSAGELEQTPYADRTIARTNTWRWNAGRTVFELVAPGGDTYVMQSYAQIADPALTLAKLPRLASRIELPDGWRYRSRTLRSPLSLVARGSATILQDELQNTYQLATTTKPKGRARRRAVKLGAKTKMVTPAPRPGVIEDRGTVTSTPFGDGRITLRGAFTAGRFDATFRLTFARGSVVGRASLPFTISGNEIDFRGTGRLTGGTGAFRGITGRALQIHDHNTLDGQNGVVEVTGFVTY